MEKSAGAANCWRWSDLLLLFLVLCVGRLSQSCMSFWLNFGFVGNERWGHTQEGVAKRQEQIVSVGERQSLFGSGLSLFFFQSCCYW